MEFLTLIPLAQQGLLYLVCVIVCMCILCVYMRLRLSDFSDKISFYIEVKAPKALLWLLTQKGAHIKLENTTSYPLNLSQGYTSDSYLPWIGPNHDQLNKRTGSKQRVIEVQLHYPLTVGKAQLIIDSHDTKQCAGGNF